MIPPVAIVLQPSLVQHQLPPTHPTPLQLQATPHTARFISMSNSSLSSFFSASPGTQDSTSFSGDSLSVGGSASSSGSSVSDTVRNSATITPTSSFGSVSEIRLTSSTASNLSNLLSVSLSLDTIGSHQSISSTTPVPPYPIKVSKMRVLTLVDLKSSPFVRRRKFAARFSDEQEQKPVITTPTPARLRSLMKEKLYIGGWIVSFILDNKHPEANLC